MDTPFLGPWGISRSPNLARNELINLFAEMVETKDGFAVGAFFSAPGLDLLATVGPGPIRGGITMGGYLYVVSGNEVWQVSANWQKVFIGTIQTASDPVSLISNGSQINIFDGLLGYLLANIASTTTFGINDQLTTSTNAPGANTIFLVSFIAPVNMTLKSVSCVPAEDNPTAKFASVLYAGITAGSAHTLTGDEMIGASKGHVLTSSLGAGAALVAGTAYTIGFITDSAVALHQLDDNPGGSLAANTYGSGAPGVLPAMSAGYPNWQIYGTAELAPLTLTTLKLPFDNPQTAVYQDGFGLVSFAQSQDIAQSNLRDLSTWDALNFSTADSTPGNILRLFDIHEEVFVIKETDTEVWVNAGLTGFAFQRLTGVHIEAGTVAPYSVAKAGETLIVVSRNSQGQGIIVQLTGYNNKPISTQALDAEMAKYPRISDAIGYAYQQEGHTFYVITFPSANATWAIDLTTTALAGIPMWARRTAFGTVEASDSGLRNRHWGNAFIPFQGSSPTHYIQRRVDIGTYGPSFNDHEIEGTAAQAFPSTFRYALISLWLDMSTPGNFTVQFQDFLDFHFPGFTFSFRWFGVGDPANFFTISMNNGATHGGHNYIGLVDYPAPVNFAADLTHLMVSIDSVGNVVQFAINDVLQTAFSTTWGGSAAMSPGAGIFGLIQGGGLDSGPCCIGDAWISDTAAFFDLSVEANRRKFIDAAGDPVSLGNNGELPTGTPPQVYLAMLDGPLPISFLTNRGSGGADFDTTHFPGEAELRFCDVVAPVSTLGVSVIGDYRNGNLYQFNMDTLTDNGFARKWVRSWRALAKAQTDTVTFSELMIQMETGAQIKPGETPAIVLRWSDDGGHTWRGDRIMSLAPLGGTAARIFTTRLGSTRKNSGLDRIFELSSTDAFKVALLGASIEAE